MSDTIDLRMTWRATLPALIALIENGTPKGKAFAKEELERMAMAADVGQDASVLPAPLPSTLRDPAKPWGAPLVEPMPRRHIVPPDCD